jgi:hypothetical protein
MKVSCSTCARTSRPTPEQAAAARHALAGALTDILLGCPECHRFTFHRIEPEVDDTRPSRAPGLSFRCPVAGCAGWLTYVERRGLEGAHHRCARCHSVWFSLDSLQHEIAKIIEFYPYRGSVYRRTDGGFTPVSVADMPDDYESRVREEPDGRTRTHVRG